MATAEQHYILPRPAFDKPVKILIVVSPYYKDIADNLVAGAKAEIEAANLHVCGAMTLEGAPHLKKEHYPVFDCANR